MSANPHANGGLLLQDLNIAGLSDYAVKSEPGRVRSHSGHGQVFARCDEAQPSSSNFRLFSPDENNSNRWQDVFEVTNRAGRPRFIPTTTI